MGVTALQTVRDVAKVEPGQRVLITGASDGVGSMAVRIARRFGTHVTGPCSTPHVELVHALVGNHTLADLRRALTPHGMLIPSASQRPRPFAARAPRHGRHHHGLITPVPHDAAPRCRSGGLRPLEGVPQLVSSEAHVVGRAVRLEPASLP